MGKSIGIDLGTTNSVVAFKTDIIKITQNKENEDLTRSCVAQDNSKIIVGKYAYNNLKKDPQNTILSIKRLMGGGINDEMVQSMISSDYYKFGITKLQGGTDDSVAVLLGGKQYTPELISAEILKKLKEDAEAKLGGEVTHAVITVPAYFTEKQKNATRKAAFLAGLKVQQLLKEPTAAALAYGVDTMNPDESKTLLIYDFGGGTFDLSILSIAGGLYGESGTGGDRWLGGDDIDKRIHELVYQKIKKEYNIADINKLIDSLTTRKKNKFEAELRNQIEEAKKQLSSTDSATIQIDEAFEDEKGNIIDINFNISRLEFENSIRSIVQRTIDLIEELFVKTGFSIDIIDHILLVGGSSCIPLVKEMLTAKYGLDKIQVSEKPMLAVAHGAAILAHRLTDEFECPNCAAIVQPNQKVCKKCSIDVEKLTKSDIEEPPITATSHNYYIQVLNSQGEPIIGNNGRIIEAAEVLPLSKSKVFYTASNNQKIVDIRIFSDVEDGNYNKETTGYYSIEENLPVNSELVFNFELDKDEVFKISVYPKNKKNKEKQIVLGRGSKDSDTLEFFTDCLKVVLSSDFSTDKKEEFITSLQKEIIKVDKIGVNNPDSDEWTIIKANIEVALEKAKREEDRPDLSLIFAQILCNNYEGLISHTDYSKLQDLLNGYNKTLDNYQKQHIIAELKDITDGYDMLIHLFLLRMAASEAQRVDPSDSIYLNNTHNQIVNHFQNGEFGEGAGCMTEAFEIAKKYLNSDVMKDLPLTGILTKP